MLEVKAEKQAEEDPEGMDQVWEPWLLPAFCTWGHKACDGAGDPGARGGFAVRIHL